MIRTFVYKLKPSEQRTLHAPTATDTVRRSFRAHLCPLLADAPQAWFGCRLTPGVRGLMFGNHLMLVPVPPNRRLWSNRKAPTARGRLVSRPGGGTDVRLSVYTPGFPYRTTKDPAATAFFDDWLNTVVRELGAERGASIKALGLREYYDENFDDWT
jgi:hypothetical protein